MHQHNRQRPDTLSEGSAGAAAEKNSSDALSAQGHGCSSGSMVVMDGETTKLNVPMHAVVLPMQSSSTTAPGAPRQPPHMQRSSTPTLCRLYLQGRCRQQERCHQVHADRSVIEQLREQIRRRPPCCCIHTPDLVLGVDGVMPWGLPPAAHLVVDASMIIPLLSTAPTVGLLQLYRLHGSLALECSSSQFCRNHQPIPSDGASSSSLMCRFGDTCRYLHVCRTSRERLMEDSRRRSDEFIRLPTTTVASSSISIASRCTSTSLDEVGGGPSTAMQTQPAGGGAPEAQQASADMMSFRSELTAENPTSSGGSASSTTPMHLTTAHDPYYGTLSGRRRTHPTGASSDGLPRSPKRPSPS